MEVGILWGIWLRFLECYWLVAEEVAGGNTSFASSVNREPLLGEAGQTGEEVLVELELKLVADVGIVGAPNAGKSTLLSRCSAAKPKVASYPFTTLEPVLGVCEAYDSTFVAMEVPGLLEGAHKGVGLGHKFLQHAERVRLIWHLVDGSHSDIGHQLDVTNGELRSYSSSLDEKPQFIVVNKVDIPDARHAASELRERLARTGCKVYGISSYTGEGTQELLNDTQASLGMMRSTTGTPSEEDGGVVNAIKGLGREYVSRVDDGYSVHSDRLIRIAQMVNLKDRRVVDQFFNEMVRTGLDKAMEELGVQPGDRVRVGRADLEWR